MDQIDSFTKNRVSVSDTLLKGDKLEPKQKIVSKNKTYQFKVNVYGNLVLKNYKTQEKIWSFETN